MKSILCVFFSVWLLAPWCAAGERSVTTLDVLVVYTPGTEEIYGRDPDSRFNHLFAVTNKIFADSQVNLQLRLVHSVLVDYTDHNDGETALHDITYARVAAFSNIAALREQYRADMVVLYRPYQEVHGGCGIAWVGGEGTDMDFSGYHNRDFQYSHIAVNGCGDFVTAHELGHNLGLRHSRVQDGVGGTADFALGHGEMGEFTTIMAYQSAYDVDYWAGKVYRYSNPFIECRGKPCGVDRHDPMGADAHFVLNFTGPQVANFFGEASHGFDAELQAAFEQMQAAEASYQAAQKAFGSSVKRLDGLARERTETRASLRKYQKATSDNVQEYEQALRQFKLAASLVAHGRARVSQSTAVLQAAKNPVVEEQAHKNLRRVLENFDRFNRAAENVYAQLMTKVQQLNQNKDSLAAAIVQLQRVADQWLQQSHHHEQVQLHLEAAEQEWNHYNVRFNNLLSRAGKSWNASINPAIQ